MFVIFLVLFNYQLNILLKLFSQRLILLQNGHLCCLLTRSKSDNPETQWITFLYTSSNGTVMEFSFFFSSPGWWAITITWRPWSSLFIVVDNLSNSSPPHTHWSIGTKLGMNVSWGIQHRTDWEIFDLSKKKHGHHY